MSNLPLQKKILLGAFALSTFMVPVIFGASAQSDEENLRPLVRIAPEYPTEALQAGREGVVELEFTIAANGTTKDIVVVDASSPEFESPAVAALLLWRYQPTNVECDGAVCAPIANVEAVERRGVRTTLRWQLERGNAAPQ